MQNFKKGMRAVFPGKLNILKFLCFCVKFLPFRACSARIFVYINLCYVSAPLYSSFKSARDPWIALSETGKTKHGVSIPELTYKNFVDKLFKTFQDNVFVWCISRKSVCSLIYCFFCA